MFSDREKQFGFKMIMIGFAIGLFIYLYYISHWQKNEFMMVSSEPDHINTTTAAPGYTPDLNEPPYDPDAQISSHQCLTLDRENKTERKSSIPDKCRPGEEKVGFICYSKCPDKWSPHHEFPDACQRCRDYSDSCDFLDLLVQKRTRTGTAVYCTEGQEKIGGLCYEPCPIGYKSESNLCFKCLD
jgi:hypothetical protein